MESVVSNEPAESMASTGDSSNEVQKKKRKPYTFKDKVEQPRRLKATDVRRTYSQLLFNTFNSCDLSKLRSVLDKYCVEDVCYSSVYDGTNNPYAAEALEVRGIDGNMELWTALIKSAPDFFFHGEFLDAYMDPSIHLCVVRSRFSFSGTRVVDVKIAQETNDKVVEEKLKNKEQYTTDETELMEQIHEQLASTYNDSEETPGTEDPDTEFPVEPDVLANANSDRRHSFDESSVTDGDDANTATATATAAATATEDSSLFKAANSKVNLDGVKLYTDAVPLEQTLTMKCNGTLTVYLNEFNKITKYEFLYKV